MTGTASQDGNGHLAKGELWVSGPMEAPVASLNIRPFNACHVGAWLEILNSKTNKVVVQLVPYLTKVIKAIRAN